MTVKTQKKIESKVISGLYKNKFAYRLRINNVFDVHSSSLSTHFFHSFRFYVSIKDKVKLEYLSHIESCLKESRYSPYNDKSFYLLYDTKEDMEDGKELFKDEVLCEYLPASQEELTELRSDRTIRYVDDYPRHGCQFRVTLKRKSYDEPCVLAALDSISDNVYLDGSTIAYKSDIFRKRCVSYLSLNNSPIIYIKTEDELSLFLLQIQDNVTRIIEYRLRGKT